MESTTSTTTEKEKDHNDFNKKQNAELKKANKELWKKVEDLQREKTSITKENEELKKKIEVSPFLPGNIYFDIFLLNISILILQVRRSRSKLRVWTRGRERGDPVPVPRTIN